ncbi:hypothetical protein [Ruegeria lacuscaerulensis]|uniref:hypothetical protein n=1 Tax=Ruegeria lacuscaerulensis TaxID=55218 RepID=UPI001479B52A|nr:hypothetical protein [Ruegeria lacuscaerulensis]
MWWIISGLIIFFAYLSLRDRQPYRRREKTSTKSYEPLPQPIKVFHGVGSGIISFNDERTRIEIIQQFEGKAKVYLLRNYSEPLPQELLAFLREFSNLGMMAFPNGGRMGKSIEIRTESELLIQVNASTGMYWTDPDYGHIDLKVDPIR